MIEIFELLPSAAAHELDVEAAHDFSLPGVSCDLCGEVWATTGLSWPTVDISTLAKDYSELTDPSPVSPARFETVAYAVRKASGRLLDLAPGTEFGVLQGSWDTPVSDFAWVNPWTPLLAAECAENLLNHFDISLCAVTPSIVARDGSSRSYRELEIEPQITVRDRSRLPHCSGCGRCRVRADDLRRLGLESSNVHAELVRVREVPTVIIGSRRFKDAVSALDCTGITFRPV